MCVQNFVNAYVLHFPEVNTLHELKCGVSPFASIWHPIGAGISPWTYVNRVTRCERIEHYSYSTNRKLTLNLDWCNMYKLFSENQSKTKGNLWETSMYNGHHSICLMYKISVLTGFITLGCIIHRIKVSLDLIGPWNTNAGGVNFCTIHLSIAISDPYHKNTMVWMLIKSISCR